MFTSAVNWLDIRDNFLSNIDTRWSSSPPEEAVPNSSPAGSGLGPRGLDLVTPSSDVTRAMSASLSGNREASSGPRNT